MYKYMNVVGMSRMTQNGFGFHSTRNRYESFRCIQFYLFSERAHFRPDTNAANTSMQKSDAYLPISDLLALFKHLLIENGDIHRLSVNHVRKCSHIQIFSLTAHLTLKLNFRMIKLKNRIFAYSSGWPLWKNECG